MRPHLSRRVARAAQAVIEAFAQPGIEGAAYRRLSTVVYRIRILIGIAALGVSWALPEATVGERVFVMLLVGLIYIPYGITLYVLSRRSDHPALRMSAVAGDMALVFMFHTVVPQTRIIALFGYLLILAFYAYLGGIAAGATVAMAAMALTATAEAIVPEHHRLGLYTISLYWAVLASMTVLVNAATREQQDLVRHLRQNESALRRMDEIRTTLLETVSHDLRTPLMSIRGFAETIRQRGPDIDEHTKSDLLDRIVVNTDRMTRLLSDLLDLQRLSERAFQLKREPLDVGELARRAVEHVELRGREVQIVGDDTIVSLDRAQVERILENLLHNVDRHTPSASHVWIRTNKQDAGVMLVVEDDGPGVPDDLKQAVFEPFRSGGTGTGLGLSLVSRLAELHEGQAWVEDRPGGGARFCVYLPAPSS